MLFLTLIEKTLCLEQKEKASINSSKSRTKEWSSYYRKCPANNDILVYYKRRSFILNDHLRRSKQYFAIELLFPCSKLAQNPGLLEKWAPRILFLINVQSTYLQSFLEMTTSIGSSAAWSNTRKGAQILRCGNNFCAAPITEAYFAKVLLSPTRMTLIYVFQGWREEDHEIWPGTEVSLPVFDFLDICGM